MVAVNLAEFPECVLLLPAGEMEGSCIWNILFFPFLHRLLIRFCIGEMGFPLAGPYPK